MKVSPGVRAARLLCTFMGLVFIGCVINRLLTTGYRRDELWPMAASTAFLLYATYRVWRRPGDLERPLTRPRSRKENTRPEPPSV